jgi:hypothetical protein
LDEGLLSFCLPVPVHMEEAYAMRAQQWRIPSRPRIYSPGNEARRLGGDAPAEAEEAPRALDSAWREWPEDYRLRRHRCDCGTGQAVFC